jgi:cell division protease FtsH
VKLAANVDLDQIAGLTPGFTGADLANLVNEAAIVATWRNGEAVTLDDFTVAIERIVAGLEKRSRILSPEERRRVAYHETLYLPAQDRHRMTGLCYARRPTHLNTKFQSS